LRDVRRRENGDIDGDQVHWGDATAALIPGPALNPDS
jgi:hypothetical protein